MAVRFHFDAEDLTQISFAATPDPLWEVMLSLHVLQTKDGSPQLRKWKRDVRDVRGVAGDSARRLIALTPAHGYSPDFLTPAAAAQGFEPGIEALLSTPRHRLHTDLARLAAGNRLPSWARRLAVGDTAEIHRLGARLRAYYDGSIAPYWPLIRAHFDADVGVRARHLLHGGVERMLAKLHPAINWTPPVLSVGGMTTERDVYLRGRGLRFVPSFFCRQAPIVLRDETLPPVLVYPIEHEMRLPGSAAEAHVETVQSLAALLGPTRAAVLEVIADGCATTTELARRVGISPAMASRHAGVLRDAGLVTTRRIGGSVNHTLHPLGEGLLNRGLPVPITPADR